MRQGIVRVLLGKVAFFLFFLVIFSIFKFSSYGCFIIIVSFLLHYSIPFANIFLSLFSPCWLRYKKLLCSVDLTKDFYFSYAYHVMRSLQKNMKDYKTGDFVYETMFVWNEFLTREIRSSLKNTLWTVALVYGFFKQVSQ